MYKAATVLCAVKDDLNLTTLDLQNIFDICAACPQPEKTLKNILQLLINKIKTIDDLINDLGGGSSSDEVIIHLATCFRTDDGSGDVISDLKHSDYTKAIGLQVCSMLTDMAGFTTRLTSIEDNVDSLQSRVQVLENGDNGLAALDLRMDTLEGTVSGMVTVLGPNTDLAAITSEECPTSGTGNSVPSLAAGDGSALWTGNSQNVAESVKRLWLAMCDVRGAVKIIQDNCCKITCDDVAIDFDIRLSDDRTQATLFFAFKSQLPNGFKDYNALGNKLLITDANGAQASFFIKIADEVQNPDGLILDLSGTALDPAQDYFFTMDAAMSDGSITCSKCINKTATYKDTCAYCELTAVASSGHSTTTATSGNAVLIYTLPGDTTPQYLTIAAGTTIVIKKAAVISDVLIFGDLQVTSSCGDTFLPTASTMNCYTFNWDIGNSSGNTNALSGPDLVSAFVILGQTYVAPHVMDNNHLDLYAASVKDTLAAAPAIKYLGTAWKNFANHTKLGVRFQTTDKVFQTMKMFLNNDDGVNPPQNTFIVLPIASDKCDAPTDPGDL
jgi:hypothetical protein